MSTQDHAVLQFPIPSRQPLLAEAFALITRAEVLLDELDKNSEADIRTLFAGINARFEATGAGPAREEWLEMREYLNRLEETHAIKAGAFRRNMNLPVAPYEADPKLEEVCILLREHLRDAHNIFGPKKLAAVLRYQAIHSCCTAEAHEACDAMLAAIAV